MSDAFERSRADGPHALLARLAGRWRGTAKTWFQPGELADTSEIQGVVRAVLDGRFVVHEYRSTLQGMPFEGALLVGHHLEAERFEASWIDGVHCGTSLMPMVGELVSDTAFGLRGEYAAGDETWGWRMQHEIAGPEELLVTHFNVTPAGQEAQAIEIDYRRVF